MSTGSFCKNTLDRTPPFVCEGDDAPICSCVCEADWAGDFCDVWNGPGSGPNASNKSSNYLRNLAQTALDEYNRHRQSYNVFDGGLGLGFDARTGETRAPILDLDFSNADNKWMGHRLPAEATFTTLATSTPVRHSLSF